MAKLVYKFSEGDKDQKDLLGGKGANLAEMTRLGLPVPPGFTITTQACRYYLEQGHQPDQLRVQVTMALRHLEDEVGRRLGDSTDPLLVSVRSGAKYSMPGMMETVLNVGLNDHSVVGLVEESGDARFAWDSYRRLIQMFGKTVLGVDGEAFASALDAAKERRRSCSTTPAGSSRRTRATSSTWPPCRSSTPGTPTGPGSTADVSGSRTTWARR
jgi:pyruvate,orthophosphate dikinase